MSINHSNSWRPSTTKEAIKLKANYLRNIREFFYKRKVLEVDTPLLYEYAVSDPYLENFNVETKQGVRYLQTSPEYAMKRLLPMNLGSIYQICKAVRNDPLGKIHSFEFLILEWYRVDYTDKDLMNEIESLIKLFKSNLEVTYYSYLEIFEMYLNINPHTINIEDLIILSNTHIGPVVGNNLDKDDYLNLLLTHIIEPQLKTKELVFIYNYPSSQAALAKLESNNGTSVAKRFEAYYHGIEIANGYYELTDPKTQKKRFRKDIEIRRKNKLDLIDIDEKLIFAMEYGLPKCSGVAMGIERLIMAIEGVENISELIFM